MPSEYQNFVKKQMASMQDSNMKATDKMKHIAKLWQKTKTDYSEDSSEDEEVERQPRKLKTATGKRKTKKDIDLSQLLELLSK